jgi:hypothetical protein
MNGMRMDEGDARLLEPVTERIIGCAFRVANALGHGFVEKVYENALAHEMRRCGLGVVQQRGSLANIPPTFWSRTRSSSNSRWSLG